MRSSRDKSQRRWTLMFIGDHGKVIELKHIRWLIGGTLVILAAAILAAVVLFVMNQRLTHANKSMRQSLETTQTRMKKAGHQTDLLMARLALAEAQAKAATREPAAPEAGAENTSAGPPQAEPPAPQVAAASPVIVRQPPEPTPKVEPKAKAEPKPRVEPKSKSRPEVKPELQPKPELKTTPAKAVAAKAAPPSEAPAVPPGTVMVKIDNLKLTQPSGSGILQLEFKLRNVGSKPNRLEGRVIAILKGDDLLPDEWVTMPRLKLVDGRPTGNKGYRFAINNWRTMRFRTNFSGSAARYNLAEIHVYSREGEVWLREAYPVAAQ